MEEICDKCGDEMDSRTSMPNPAMGNGSLCSECYLTAEEDLAHQKGMAWIRQQLPSMGQFMEIYCRHCQVEVDKARLEGNCHAAASALVGWFIHSVISLCACKCANLPLSERVPGVTQVTVAP